MRLFTLQTQDRHHMENADRQTGRQAVRERKQNVTFKFVNMMNNDLYNVVHIF